MKAKYVQRLKIVALAIATICVVQEGQAGSFVSTIKISDDIRRIAIALRENPDVLKGFVDTKAFQSLEARIAIRAALEVRDAKEASLHLMELPSPVLAHLTITYQDQWLTSMAHRDQIAARLYTVNDFIPPGNRQDFISEIEDIAGQDQALAQKILDPLIKQESNRLKHALSTLSSSSSKEQAILEACDRFAFDGARIGLWSKNWEVIWGKLGMEKDGATLWLYSRLVEVRRLLLDSRMLRYNQQTAGTLVAVRAIGIRLEELDIVAIRQLLTFVHSKIKGRDFKMAIKARRDYLENSEKAASEAGDAASMLTRAKDEPSPYPLMIQELHDQLMSVVGDLG